MPDDPILDSSATPQETPAPEPSAPAAAPAGVSPEDFSVLQQGQAQLAQNLEQLTGALQAMAQRDSSPPQPPASAEDFASRFYTEPEDTIKEVFRRESQSVVGPMADLASSMLLENQEQRLDHEFGPGTWKEVFHPQLQPVFDHLKKSDPGQLLNRQAIENAISTIKGQRFSELAERRTNYTTASRKASEEATEAERAKILGRVGNLGGGLRPDGSGPPALTEDHKAILAEMSKADGIARDGAHYAKLLSSDVTTLEDYKKLKESA